MKRWLQKNIPLILILLLTVALRLPLLNGSFWLDESAQALESARPFSQQLAIKDDFQPPLLHLLLHFAMYLSESEWWLRTVGALLPGMISVLMTGLIGITLFNKRVGYSAALLLATSSFHVYYSQELRQYSWPAAFACISWYMLFLSWKNKAISTHHAGWFLTVSVLGMYTSYLYPFVLLGQFLFSFLYLKLSLQKFLTGVAVLVIAFLPWLPSFLEQLQAGTSLTSSLPGWSSVVSHSQVRSLPLVAAKFLYGVSNVELSPVFLVSSAVVVVGIVAASYPVIKEKKYNPKVTALLLWWIVPILLAWITSFIVPVLQPKRVLYALPGFYIFVAALVEANYSKLPVIFTKKGTTFQSILSTASTSTVVILLLINILSVSWYYRDARLQRENWRALIAQIQAQYPDRAAVLMSFDAPFAPWRWYADPRYPVFTTGTLQVQDQASVASRLKTITEYDHVLLFDYLRDLTDPEKSLEGFLTAYGYKQTGLIDYPNIGYVRIYSKPAAVVSYSIE